MHLHVSVGITPGAAGYSLTLRLRPSWLLTPCCHEVSDTLANTNPDLLKEMSGGLTSGTVSEAAARQG
ncbi:hypothetical protein GCM10009825_21620 [Arthrobacter humicola]|uniref:Uncharacterized protein n=1 Tax=Arthrobacter humicola TaxID=409291 RepID=A0ABN2Z412_9MICC